MFTDMKIFTQQINLIEKKTINLHLTIASLNPSFFSTGHVANINAFKIIAFLNRWGCNGWMESQSFIVLKFHPKTDAKKFQAKKN